MVSRGAKQIDIIGGNVDDAVTLTHVPIGPDGRLDGADGQSLDPRYQWLVVLQVLYDGDAEAPAED